jgi:uncharacterized protein DUF1329
MTPAASPVATSGPRAQRLLAALAISAGAHALLALMVCFDVLGMGRGFGLGIGPGFDIGKGGGGAAPRLAGGLPARADAEAAHARAGLPERLAGVRVPRRHERGQVLQREDLAPPLLAETGPADAPGATPPAGTTVGPEDADRVSDVLLPGVLAALRRGMRIEIVEPRPVRWRKAYMNATEQHAGQVRLGPDGALLDYVAGLPFSSLDPSDPDLGTKIAWDHAFGPWRPDDLQMWGVEWQFGKAVAGKPFDVVSQERNDAEHSRWLSVIGRTEVPPLPAFSENVDGVLTMEVFGPTLPVLLTMLRSGPMLTYRYLGAREDDNWYYISMFRQTARIWPQTRYEAEGGVVADLNSTFGFNGPVLSYSWRALGERQMLAPLHARGYPSEWCPGAGDFAPCDVWEPRSVYVIEGVPRRPYDIYGKRILAIDKQSWVVVASDLEDKEGHLWKSVINFWSYRPDPRGGEQERGYLLSGTYLDVRDNEANRWRLPGTRPLAEAVVFDSGFDKDRFTTAALTNAH